MARYDLGFSDEEFWQTTLRDLHAYYGRHVQAREHLEMMVGIIASAVANFGFSRPKKPLRPVDFGLGSRRERVSIPGRDYDPDAEARALRQFFKSALSTSEAN